MLNLIILAKCHLYGSRMKTVKQNGHKDAKMINDWKVSEEVNYAMMGEVNHKNSRLTNTSEYGFQGNFTCRCRI